MPSFISILSILVLFCRTGLVSSLIIFETAGNCKEHVPLKSRPKVVLLVIEKREELKLLKQELKNSYGAEWFSSQFCK